MPGWFKAPPPKEDNRCRLFDARAAILVGGAKALGEAPEDRRPAPGVARRIVAAASVAPRGGVVRLDGRS
ncbi:MAG: hypothetical protein A2623_12935 [Caulobacterales bacterium RIFCSPHIGHO2_01_FULL_70_19]|nr:MAG: hypothetical protein A2623_12935 [Caulobacterales bacterium RIFCSPHIGHO2_01_FULL_70_19]